MKIATLSVVALAAATPTALADKVDLSKVTCAEINRSYVDETVVIGAWLSGYYNAKKNNTIVDAKVLAQNTKRVFEFCQANPKVTVMKAVAQLNLSR